MKVRPLLNYGSVVLLALLTGIPMAAADETDALKPDQFLRIWKILGPISAFEEGVPKTVDGAKASSFDADLLAEAGGETGADANASNEVLIRGKSVTWTSVTSDSDEIDLREAVENHTWSIAYAETTFHVTEATQCALGIGSDDAVRVWLNGELVHDNWTTRPLRKDDDLVPVSLMKGDNRLLLKVLNRLVEARHL